MISYHGYRYFIDEFASTRIGFGLRRWLLVVALAGLPGLAGRAWAQAPEPFLVAALGCVPYNRTPDAGPSFERLIAEINRHAPVFTVHLGDILGSDEVCSDELYLRRRADFNRFEHPLIYTPGDNEWTDAHTEKAGRYRPLERLARIREYFFVEERSLGRKRLPLVTQRRDRRFSTFVENARWSHGGIVFATVHVVGSRNNQQPEIPGAMEEFQQRDAANAAWIRATFAEARETKAPGVALFFQANPFAGDYNRPGYREGYEHFLKVLEAEARAFARPVLLVHADEHRFRLDFGMRFTKDADLLPNVTRVETFGDRNLHGALIIVDPGTRQVFLPGPLVVPGNATPRLERRR